MAETTLTHLNKDSSNEVIAALAQIGAKKILDFQKKLINEKHVSTKGKKKVQPDKILKEMEIIKKSLEDSRRRKLLEKKKKEEEKEAAKLKREEAKKKREEEREAAKKKKEEERR